MFPIYLNRHEAHPSNWRDPGNCNALNYGVTKPSLERLLEGLRFRLLFEPDIGSA